ncbi:hypothetical protein B9479_002438 [Cryptococcus floricola]|uniref:Peptidyl-prolyl cis-trans isomerase n=1 Tax=Cryptococcus floricola TaxID=2591691 RepID=A0A5D3B158_9TREE|nr:hypothetical protein B9479_002438 [Cryptococcus floricola]
MSVTLHTNLGDIKIEVFCESVPRTAENFLALCASGSYDNTLFHRNIKSFMVQGGDPTGTGKGGMRPDTNKSQFFITYAKQSSLDGKYSIFGKVIDGLEVLDTMERTPVNPKNRPLKEIRLERVTVHANPIADQAK